MAVAFFKNDDTLEGAALRGAKEATLQISGFVVCYNKPRLKFQLALSARPAASRKSKKDEKAGGNDVPCFSTITIFADTSGTTCSFGPEAALENLRRQTIGPFLYTTSRWLTFYFLPDHVPIPQGIPS